MAEISISEVTRQTGIQPSALRYYEEIGLLAPTRRIGGRRHYDEGVLQRLALIQTGQQAGFTLAGKGHYGADGRYLRTDPTNTVGRIFATNNLELNTTWSQSSTNTKKGLSIVWIVPGTNDVFTPPYAYQPDATDKVKTLVISGAGAGKMDPSPGANRQ